MLFSKFSKVALASLIAVSASYASAATLTVNSVQGVWQNAVDTNGGAINGAGTNAISWGGGASQSAYTFVGAAHPAVTVEEEEDFSLGVFTHDNFPIFPPTLASAELLVTIGVDGFGDIETLFSFEHTETINTGACSFGGANGQGVNINGCADNVSAVLNLGSSETFNIDGTDFVFNVSGFETDDALFESFLTVENASNSAGLIGSFVVVDDISPVPLPAGGLLLLSGFGLLGFARRRKTKAA